MSYVDAAGRVGDWLTATARREPDGWWWDRQPGVAGTGVFPGVGWGTAGPTLFFVEAYRTTGESRWLEAARGGARWMAANLTSSVGQADGAAGCGLFTGVGGWVVALDALADVTGESADRDQARAVLAAVAGRATPAGPGRVHWHGLNEILWGTAGIGCLMLRHGPSLLGPRSVELAVAAGDWLIDQAEDAPPGLCWSLGASYELERPDDVRRFPNFAHGAAGIAFFLARLYQVTGEQRFLDAAMGAVRWIMTTVRTDRDTCAAFHHTNGGTDEFTLGWCHGPPGLGWMFRQLEIATGDRAWRSWLRRAARADATSGIPEQRAPGFWDNVARCCGSAGVAEFFLDLHRLEGRAGDLAFARTMVDDLLARAIVDGTGMRWSNVEHRAEEPNLPPETIYLQGASGIGSTLLRLHRHLSGDPWVLRWPHAPTWDQAAEGAPRS